MLRPQPERQLAYDRFTASVSVAIDPGEGGVRSKGMAETNTQQAA